MTYIFPLFKHVCSISLARGEALFKCWTSLTDCVVNFAFPTNPVRVHRHLLRKYIEVEAMFLTSYERYHTDAFRYGIEFANQHMMFRKELTA